jgi:hypothetical protein
MGVGGIGGGANWSSFPGSPDPHHGLPPLTGGAGAGGKPIDLFPKDVFNAIAKESLARDAAAAEAAKRLSFPAASGAAAERAREQYLGPTYAALAGMKTAPGLDDQLQGQAALAALPAAMIGSLAKPLVDKGYSVIDRVPAALRRPLEKNFGLLIDTAMAATSAGSAAFTGATTFNGVADGPDRVQLAVPAYGQITMGCGETAAATLLKSAGVPLSLGQVDTQVISGGGNLLLEQEFRRNGLSFVNGPGNLDSLQAFVASGYPVMVSIARDGTSDHYATVTGYDKAKGTLTIANYDAQGNTVTVPADKFSAEWAAHANYMTAVVPKRDARIEPLLKAGDVRRRDEVGQGLTLTDFYVTKAGKVFVEGGYRYVSGGTDVTVKVNWNNKEEELSRQLGGSIAIRQKVADNLHLGLRVEKMSLRGQADDWTSFKTAPLSAYASVEGKGFEVRAGGERGAFQASVAADLGNVLAGMGVRASATVNPDGTYKVLGGISGTF